MAGAQFFHFPSFAPPLPLMCSPFALTTGLPTQNISPWLDFSNFPCGSFVTCIASRHYADNALLQEQKMMHANALGM